ncbi:MAG: hypothetical protein M3P41_13160 [Actinomycetota bacterium]|nr:hypothetical protein [Actinomycetota bacterium]
MTGRARFLRFCASEGLDRSWIAQFAEGDCDRTTNDEFVVLNLQEARGQAKPYQIRQFLRLVERYALSLEAEE